MLFCVYALHRKTVMCTYAYIIIYIYVLYMYYIYIHTRTIHVHREREGWVFVREKKERKIWEYLGVPTPRMIRMGPSYQREYVKILDSFESSSDASV